MDRSIGARLVVFALASGALAAGRAAWGQVVQTGTANMPAAQALPPANHAQRNMRSPAAAAIYNQREQMMEHHHLPIPLGKAPAVPHALAAVQPGPQTPLSTPLSPLAGSQVSLLSQHAFSAAETGSDTSTICEPSVGTRGNEVFYTGNWFAAFSSNGGTSFTFVNPATTFPASPHGAFCCDQVVVYDRGNDAMFWLLQYQNDATGNIQRLAVAQGADIANENWHYYDWSPQSVGNWANEWFDFPNLVLGSNYLYLSSNTFSTMGNPQPFARSVMIRFPLAQLAKYQGFSYNYFNATDVGGLRATQGATTTMYWAAHVNTQTIRVFTWPESSTSVSQNDVGVQSWSDSKRVAPGPDGRDWLGREDSRINGAWQTGNSLGFAWTAAQDANFPFPQVRVAILDSGTKAVNSQPHIWNKDFAYAYPALAPNSSGTVGISVAYGGKTIYPSHTVGILNNGAWDLVVTANGTSGPSDGNYWGDYLTIHPHGSNPQTWVATGYTLQGGSTRSSIQPLYINFKGP